MAITLSSVNVSPLGSGLVVVCGLATFDSSYAGSGGEVMDLSAYFDGSPIVIANGDDGYVVQHNRGTAAAGKLIAYLQDTDGGPLIEVTATTDLSAVICPFVAFGTANL